MGWHQGHGYALQAKAMAKRVKVYPGCTWEEVQVCPGSTEEEVQVCPGSIEEGVYVNPIYSKVCSIVEYITVTVWRL